MAALRPRRRRGTFATAVGLLLFGACSGERLVVETDQYRVVAEDLRIQDRTLVVEQLQVAGKGGRRIGKASVVFSSLADPTPESTLARASVDGEDAERVVVVPHERRPIGAAGSVFLKGEIEVGGETMRFGATVPHH